MKRVIDPFLGELEQEAAATRRLLERVPDAQLGWRPHARSMPLGALARHVATIPAMVPPILARDRSGIPEQELPAVARTAELVPLLDASLAQGRETLNTFTDARMAADWVLEDPSGREIMRMPRAATVRFFLLNHWYHHRGQLTVYLRMLDVPLPSVYGPTADENPFAR